MTHIRNRGFRPWGHRRRVVVRIAWWRRCRIARLRQLEGIEAAVYRQVLVSLTRADP